MTGISVMMMEVMTDSGRDVVMIEDLSRSNADSGLES